jgi:hypothetical protein
MTAAQYEQRHAVAPMGWVHEPSAHAAHVLRDARAAHDVAARAVRVDARQGNVYRLRQAARQLARLGVAA